MHTTGSRPRLVVSADGRGVVSHAGSRLLADLAEVTGLTSAFTSALRRLRPRGTGHAPGRVAVDLAVMLADGGETITDLAVLRDQREVFGPVAATPTAWRPLADIGPPALAALQEARATRSRRMATIRSVADSSTRSGSPYCSLHPRGWHPALRGHRGGAPARIPANAVRGGGVAAEVPPSAGRRGARPTGRAFQARRHEYAVEQLDWIRAQFSTSHPDDRPA